jgi:hypothetical protein
VLAKRRSSELGITVSSREGISASSSTMSLAILGQLIGAQSNYESIIGAIDRQSMQPSEILLVVRPMRL